MRELIILPVIGLALLGFVPELVAIASSSQDKAIDFADDMNAAIDCATRGIPLEICSPGLMSHDFQPEFESVSDINRRLLDYLAVHETVDVVVEGNRTIIVLS